MSTRATEAKELFRQLVSDCCKKIRETSKRRKINQFTRNEEADAQFEESLPVEDVLRITNEERYTMRVALINTASIVDVVEAGPPSVYSWCTAVKTQLVVLTSVSLIRLHEAIKGRYRTARYKVLAIFGSLTKPLADGTCPKEDIVRITSDHELVDFIITAKEAYCPVWLQMQVHKKNTHDNTPPPDERPYFELEDFKPLDPMADYYNAPENDSDTATYFLATGKRKKLAWPRTDGGFEMGKYDARCRIKRLEKHLERLKTKQRANICPNTIVYDSDSDEYGWML